MKKINLEIDIKNLTEKSLYTFCLASTLQDYVSNFIAGTKGLSREKVRKDIENRTNQYFKKMRDKFAPKSVTVHLTDNMVKWLISDDPNLPKPPDVK